MCICPWWRCMIYSCCCNNTSTLWSPNKLFSSMTMDLTVGTSLRIWIWYEITQLKVNYACFSNYWNQAKKMFNYVSPIKRSHEWNSYGYYARHLQKFHYTISYGPNIVRMSQWCKKFFSDDKKNFIKISDLLLNLQKF